MNSRVTPPPADPSAEEQDRRKNNAFLRGIRTEVQDLRMIVDSVCRGETTIQANAKYIAKTMEDLAALVGQVSGDDTVSHVRNLFEQMSGNPLLINPGRKTSAEDQLHYLNLLQQQFRKMEFYTGIKTIPDRVNDWLKVAKPGYYLPFHIIFEDEVPEPEDRAKILSYLAWAPKSVSGGFVDAANGVIYKYSDRLLDRLSSILVILLGFAAATLLIGGSCYLGIEGWPFRPAEVSTFVIAWAILLIGIVVHVGIGSLKQARQQGNLPSVASIGDFTLLLDARVGSILRKLLFALIGFFLLAFTAGVSNFMNAFLVGYSLDSVIEVFGTGVEKLAGEQVNEVKKQLKMA